MRQRHSARRDRVWQRDRAANGSGHRGGREVPGPTGRTDGDHRSLRCPGRDPARRDYHRAASAAGHVLDTDYARAEGLAARAAGKNGVRLEAAKDLEAALRESDVCVTCTTSRHAFVQMNAIVPGTFIAAVGADNPEKQEIESALLASATLVVDVLDQCAEIGELHHALAANLLRRVQVHAELAEIVAGRRPGRTREGEITIFDSSGTALQDVAASVAVFEKARATGRGTAVNLEA